MCLPTALHVLDLGHSLVSQGKVGNTADEVPDCGQDGRLDEVVTGETTNQEDAVSAHRLLLEALEGRVQVVYCHGQPG